VIVFEIQKNVSDSSAYNETDSCEETTIVADELVVLSVLSAKFEQEETGNVVFEYSAVYDAGSENKKLGSDSDYGLRLPALEFHSKAVHPVLP